MQLSVHVLFCSHIPRVKSKNALPLEYLLIYLEFIFSLGTRQQDSVTHYPIIVNILKL